MWAKPCQSGGTIAIVGKMVDDSRLTPPADAAFNVVLLNIHEGGCCHTEGEHREWLDRAGFTDFKRQPLPGGSQVVTTRKG